MLDVIIIGGGPAGLSAALVLGRCRRNVLVIDAGEHRNRAAQRMSGFLTRDGIAPADFLALARAELPRYSIEFLRAHATGVVRLSDGTFEVQTGGPTPFRARKLLLATGMRDSLPRIEGLEPLYGATVHHCPYCDGWEHRDRRLVAFGSGNAAVGLAMSLRTWSSDVTACTDAGPLDDEHRQSAARLRIPVREERVVRLEGEGSELRRVHFEHARALECDALFFNTGQYQRSDLPQRLGCAFKDDGGVRTTDRQCTGVPGLYLAGDADRDVQFVIVAAAEGAVAATAINRELQDAADAALTHQAVSADR